jgi:hypothetical protein
VTTYRVTFSNDRYSSTSDAVAMPVAGLPTIWSNKPCHRIKVPPPYVAQPAPLPFSYTKTGLHDQDEDDDDHILGSLQPPTPPTFKTVTRNPLPDVTTSKRGHHKKTPRELSGVSIRSGHKHLPDVFKLPRGRPDFSWCTKQMPKSVDSVFYAHKPGWKPTTLVAK